jgi:rSAM/selenodomain-associated transferase 1
MRAEHLVIFVRAPRPGTVKTRLAQTIGAPAACGAYQHLVQTLVHRLKHLPEVQLRFTPDDAIDEIRPWLQPGWSVRPQGAGDLGARLSAAFAESFARGAQRVVIIGSDCPDVAQEDIAGAWSELTRRDVVLGPAKDGGYWLIGLRRPRPELFSGVPWGNEMVRAETLERARKAGLSLWILRELADVDTEADWRDFLSRQHPDTAKGCSAR